MKGIVAIGNNGVIGNNGGIPWHYPEDLQNFRRQTLNSAVIMGRKTYQSLGKPLDKRVNIVVTRDDSYDPRNGVHTTHSKLETLNLLSCLGFENCWVIGGTEVYNLFWDNIQEFHVTRVLQDYPGDTFFPVAKLLTDFSLTSARTEGNLRYEVYKSDKLMNYTS